MITVAGRAPIKPEMREEAAAILIKMTQATQVEDGCLQYHFYFDVEDPNTVHVFEEWETQESLDAHFASAHMADFSSALPGILAGEPKIMRYVVSEVTRLM